MQDSRADELRASLTVLNVDFVLAVVVGAFVQLPESHPVQDDIAATEDRIDVTLTTADLTGQDFGDMTRGDEIPCGAIGYLLQKNPTELWTVDLVTGENSLEVSSWSDQLNGVGYDVFSGMVWGGVKIGGGNHEPNRHRRRKLEPVQSAHPELRGNKRDLRREQRRR